LTKLFTDTANKSFIRTLDCGFVRDEFEHHGRKLRYFGLPSEGLYDIKSWNEYISDVVAVEMGSGSDPSSKQNLIVCRAIQLGYCNRLTLLRGEINKIIMDDEDDLGTRVPYPFELVNLDYGGSILYPDRIRIDALEILVRRQRPIDFLLLVTSNIREFDPSELIKTQRRIRKELTQYRSDLDNRVKLYFQQLNENKSLLRQIVHLYFLVKYLAEQNRYQITCFPAILYEGSRKTRLIHYIFRLRYQENASTRVISDQSLIDLLNQNAQELVNDNLAEIKPPFTLD